jgi:hypothetical protein
MELLALAVKLFHICVILFVLCAPFVKIASILILHITFCILLMTHWAFNSDVCALTEIECLLTNKPRTESFTHQFVAPMYNISETDWNDIVWVITIIAMLISIYNLIYNTAFLEVIDKVYQSGEISGLKKLFEL